MIVKVLLQTTLLKASGNFGISHIWLPVIPTYGAAHLFGPRLGSRNTKSSIIPSAIACSSITGPFRAATGITLGMLVVIFASGVCGI